MSAEEITQHLRPGSKYFATLDALMGYFQVPLDEESSYMTTFLLPSGRYRYLRAPMGLTSSSDEWCARSDVVIEGLPFALKIVDDILISAPSLEELKRNINIVLERCREMNMTISKKKFKIGSTVKFAGYIISDRGVMPDPEKVEALRNYPTPENITQLRSFLGLANQLGGFIPDLSHNCSILRELLKKEVAWQWLEVHTEAFNRVKQVLVSDLVLVPFDPTKPTLLFTDASKLFGLGYMLAQKKDDGTLGVVKCGSCSLLPAHKNYATIELELMAIVWAIEKCGYYLKGAQFSVITDHKPLIGLMEKNLCDIDNLRLLRFREQLIPYTFELKWLNGKSHEIADALSRIEAPFLKDANLERDSINSIGRIAETPFLRKVIQARDSDYMRLLEAISGDYSLQDIKEDSALYRYKSVWEELSVIGDADSALIARGQALVIPGPMRKQCLSGFMSLIKVW